MQTGFNMTTLFRQDDLNPQDAAEFLYTLSAAYLDYTDAAGDEEMRCLNDEQHTLTAYCYLDSQVQEGGFVQLIHNGLGGFIFLNPTGKAFREWGLQELFKILGKTHRLYSKYHAEIERDCDDETFMAMYEQFAEFDEFDEQFVENEELFTRQIAHYVDHHLDHFVVIAHE